MTLHIQHSPHRLPACVADPAGDEWSPPTHDLVAELPALAGRMGSNGFMLRRVMFNPADWDDPVPRKVLVNGGVIKLGAFHYQHRRTVTVVEDDGRSRITLHLPTDGGGTPGGAP